MLAPTTSDSLTAGCKPATVSWARRYSLRTRAAEMFRQHKWVRLKLDIRTKSVRPVMMFIAGHRTTDGQWQAGSDRAVRLADSALRAVRESARVAANTTSILWCSPTRSLPRTTRRLQAGVGQPAALTTDSECC